MGLFKLGEEPETPEPLPPELEARGYLAAREGQPHPSGHTFWDYSIIAADEIEQHRAVGYRIFRMRLEET